MALALMGQDFHDRIFAASTLSADALQELFDRMYAIVMERARSAVPCKSGPDPWHGPTQCVADAAYLTGLIGCVLASGWPVPDDLAELWNWFASGHWPAGFTHEPGDRPAMNEDEVTFPRRLLVY